MGGREREGERGKGFVDAMGWERKWRCWRELLGTRDFVDERIEEDVERERGGEENSKSWVMQLK